MLELCCIKPNSSRAYSWTNFFYLGSACLLNKPKIKAQAWLIYKQTSMNKLFIKSSSSCSGSTWFIYSPRSKVGYWWDIWLCGPSMNMSCDVACSKADEIVSILFYFIFFVWRDCICCCNLAGLCCREYTWNF